MTLNKILIVLATFLWMNSYSQTAIKKKYYSPSQKDSVSVTVWLPNSYTPAKKYPVFYEFVYDHSNYIASVLQNYFDAPKSIVVHADFEAGNSHYSHPGLTKEGENAYRFLIEELIPSIEKEYNTTQYRVAVGLSQGADYVNYILRNNPELFKAWLIFSIEKPNYEPIFPDYTKKVKQPIDYFIATADDEPYRVTFANKLDSNLSLNKLLNTKIKHYPNSTHAYSILYGFPDALQFIFDSYANLRSIAKNENVLAYSKNLKKEIISKYGIEPEFNNFLYHVSQELKNIKDTSEINAILKDILPNCSQLQVFNIAYMLSTNAPEKAEQLLLDAIVLMPKDKAHQQLSPVMPYRTLALNIYDKQGKYEKAFQVLKDGHEKIKKYDVGLLYYIGMYSLKRNFHIQEGVKALEDVLPKRENSQMSVFFSEDTIDAQIADGYTRLNNREQAKFYAQKALEINPNNTAAKAILYGLKKE